MSKSKTLFPLPVWLFLVALFALASGLIVSRDYLIPLGPDLAVNGGRQVLAVYDKMGYLLDAVAGGQAPVPHLVAQKFPKGWDEDLSGADKKRIFYKTILPLVLSVNAKIDQDRQVVLTSLKRRQKGQWLSQKNEARLRKIAQRYHRPLSLGTASSKALDALLKRVDQIPVSMALGQAAYESGYGTSRFALEGNALFGQWRWGKGMIPANQRTGKGDYRIARFRTLLESVQFYALNLTTHRAYNEFRQRRAQLRHAFSSGPLPGKPLVETLNRYSEQGGRYVDTLRNLISNNKLWRLDSAVLAEGRLRRLYIRPPE